MKKDRTLAKRIGIRNIVNLAFGDLRSDGSIDDKANSNNGDIVRVSATVVEILLNQRQT